jgi:hypothetical protein
MTDVSRRLVHTRSIRVDAYLRDDALWDLVATIRDVKQRDLEIDGRVTPAGAPVHDMELTVTINPFLQIVAAQARTLSAPYKGACDVFPEAYEKLVGLNLVQGFRAAVRERLGGTMGCTHITELCSVLPTAAIQAFAGEVLRVDPQSETMPMQLDRCRALRRDGPVVARLYPRWHRATDPHEGDKR